MSGSPSNSSAPLDDPASAAGTGSRVRAAMDIFAEVIGCSPDERIARLEERCGQDARLRAEVERMLAHDASGEGGFVTGAGSRFSAAEGDGVAEDSLAGLPAISGQYRIIRQLGEGGMGVVHLAEQAMPRRLVALKAVHAGVGRSILNRFMREAHILGQLHHPGIAQIHEAGVMGRDAQGRAGRACIVIEYVDGPTLTEHASRNNLDRRARLELFARVCDAVHHAHLRRVIHRDLKPPNILVDPSGQPKVLDFGIARLESDDPRLDVTRDDRALLGTPAYMSPEQIAGGEVDARADVYGLGIVLCQLLTGRLPHDVSGKSVAQVMHIVRTQAPLAASAIDPSLAGDLEAVLSTAMHTDPMRRYQSADALASDLRRHLHGEPILARTEPMGQTLLRVAKRHRGMVALGAALGVTLLGATMISLVMADRNAGLAKEANDSKLRAEAAADSLRETLYVSRVGHAQAAIATGDILRASAELEACPEALRGWEWRHLIRCTDESERRMEMGFSGPLIRLTPDGREMVCVRQDRPILLADPRTGAVIATFGQPDQFSSCKLSPDGRHLAVRRFDGVVELYDLETRQLMDRISPPAMERPPQGGAGFTQIAWAETAEHAPELLGVRFDGRCFVWSLAARKFVRDFLLAPGGTYDLTTTGEGTVGVSVHWDQSVRVFRVADGATIATLDKLGQTPVALSASSQAPIAAIGLFDGRILLWNWKSPEGGPGPAYRTIEAHASRVITLEISPDGKTLASGGEDRALKTWDMASAASIAVQQGEASRIRGLAWSPDSTEVYVAGESKTVRVFRARPVPLIPTGQLRDFPVFSCAVVPDDTMATVTTRGGHVARIKLGTGALSYLPGTTGGLRCAVQPPSGELVLAMDGGRIVFVDAGTGRSIKALPELPDAGTQMAASSGGEHLVAWQPAGTLASIDWKTREITHRWTNAGRIASVAVGPGGEIAVGEGVRVVRVVDARGEPLGPVIAPSGHARALTFSSDGSMLAASYEPSTIGIWNWRTGALVRELKGQWATIGSLAFLDNDTRLAGGGSDQLVHIWRLPAGEEVLSLGGHRGAVQNIAASGDGQTLVTADGMGIVRVWKADSMSRPKASTDAAR